MLERGTFMESYKICVSRDIVEINIPESCKRLYAPILDYALNWDLVGQCVLYNEEFICINVYFPNDFDKPKITNFVDTVMLMIIEALRDNGNYTINIAHEIETTL